MASFLSRRDYYRPLWAASVHLFLRVYVYRTQFAATRQFFTLNVIQRVKLMVVQLQYVFLGQGRIMNETYNVI